MTYLRRAFKYLLQICILFVVIIGALMLTGFIDRDVSVAFQQGWTSIGYIAAMFALVSLAYPHFGYGKRTIHAQGDPAEYWARIDAAMASRGYEKAGLGGFQAEGLVRDLARIVSAIDHKINTYGN